MTTGTRRCQTNCSKTVQHSLIGLIRKWRIPVTEKAVYRDLSHPRMNGRRHFHAAQVWACCRIRRGIKTIRMGHVPSVARSVPHLSIYVLIWLREIGPGDLMPRYISLHTFACGLPASLQPVHFTCKDSMYLLRLLIRSFTSADFVLDVRLSEPNRGPQTGMSLDPCALASCAPVSITWAI